MTPFPRFLLCQFDTDCQISLAIVRVHCPQSPAIHRASSDAIRQGRLAGYAVELVPIPFLHSPSVDSLSLSLAQATSATNYRLPRCSITHRRPPRQPPRLPPLVRVINFLLSIFLPFSLSLSQRVCSASVSVCCATP